MSKEKTEEKTKEQVKKKKAKKKEKKEKKETVNNEKGRVLSSIEKLYIIDNPNLPIDSIFDSLNGEVSKEDIETLQNAISNPEEGIKHLTSGSLMARNEKGSIVMTPGSSALSDEFKKKKKPKQDHNDRIHRIKK